MRVKLFFIASCILFLADILQAQEFQKIYLGQLYYNAPYLIETDDRGFLLAGSCSVTNGTSFSDAILVKTDSLGNVQWSYKYGHTGNEIAAGAIEINGDFYFTGWTDFGGAPHKIILCKVNNNGILLWSRVLGNNFDEGVKIQAVNGKIIIAGHASPPGKDQDFRLMKVDTAGSIIWSRAYGTTATELLNDVIQTNDGGFLMTGWSSVFDSLIEGALIVKTDSMGNLQWTRTYRNGIAQQRCYTIQQDDGSYTIGGNYNLGGHLSASLLHIDQSGNILWEKNFSRCSNLFVRKSDNASVLAAGYHVDSLSNQLHCIVYKVDSMGNLLWGRNYADSLFVIFYDMIHSSDSGYVISGFTTPYTVQSYFMLTKLNSVLGTDCAKLELPIPEYAISFSDSSIATQTPIVDTDSLFLLPMSISLVVDSSICNLINFTSQLQDNSIVLFPNPFQSNIRIEGIDNCEINIFDVMGNKIYSRHFVNEMDLSNLKNGVYFLEIVKEETMFWRKILKVE